MSSHWGRDGSHRTRAKITHGPKKVPYYFIHWFMTIFLLLLFFAMNKHSHGITGHGRFSLLHKLHCVFMEHLLLFVTVTHTGTGITRPEGSISVIHGQSNGAQVLNDKLSSLLYCTPRLVSLETCLPNQYPGNRRPTLVTIWHQRKYVVAIIMSVCFVVLCFLNA